MTKNIKQKTAKSRGGKNKNKNKKLLRKMANNSELDDVFVLDDNDSLLEENIQMLIGGTKEMVEPTKFDELIFGYKNSVDVSGPIDKITDYVGNAVTNVEKVVSMGEAIAVNKALDMAGFEGTTPEEISEELKNNSKTLEQINDYLKTNEGEKMLGEFQELSNTASGVISKSIDKLPEELDESITKVGQGAVKTAVGIATDIPPLNAVVGTSNAIAGTMEAVNAVSDAVTNVSNIVGDASEEIKQPIHEMNNKFDEMSEKISELPTVEIPRVDELPQVDELPNPMDNEIPKLVKMPEQNDGENQMGENQMGGSNINKFRNALQYGGKKLRKRINGTRHAFKNISKNITRKI